jgi:2-polyprenyl-3-methyl-5-hydroxy-6-metoxy-1,4-benzoquinol methylase
MSSRTAQHWSQRYASRAASSVSWYQAEAAPSLAMLEACGAAPPASLIDVGGGASVLVDNLLARGWTDVTVLDVAAPALELARVRLGARAAAVKWVEADITSWLPDRTFDVWHDRAVFHFLIEPAQRAAYQTALRQAVPPAGLVILATFALDGPEQCSGLPVRRYDSAQLAQELGAGFRPVVDRREVHRTPTGAEQMFTWAAFRRD